MINLSQHVIYNYEVETRTAGMCDFDSKCEKNPLTGKRGESGMRGEAGTRKEWRLID